MRKSIFVTCIFVFVFSVFMSIGSVNAANGYFDSFNNVAVGGSPTGWTSSGNWSIVTGPETPSWGAHEAYTKYYRYNSGTNITYYNQSYTDFDYTAGLILTADTTGAVIFRRTSDTNYYYYKIDSVNNKAILGKCVAGVNTDLVSINYTVDPNIWYYLRVTAVGQNIVCKILKGPDEPYYTLTHVGTTVANINDATFSAGNCGFLATGNTNNYYNNVAITDSSLDKSISNSIFDIRTGAYGEIKQLKLVGEPYDTNFVTNENTHRTEIAPNRFLGELKFKYKVGTGTEQTATTGNSSDTRNIALDSVNKKVTVSYLTNSANANGIKNFQVTETYALVDDHVQIDILIKNTSGQNISFNDIGLPISWNNHWQYDSPYERYLSASSNYISNNSSYVLLERAKGGGNKMVFTPDSSTDAGFEYRKFTSTTNTWGNPPEEYYIKSNSIKSEGQSYLPNTYLDLANGAEKKYSFKLHKAADYLAVGNVLYNEGLIDTKIEPGMILPKDMTAKIDLHTSKIINSLSSNDPNTVFSTVETRAGDHKIYNVTFSKLGRNDITITYDGNKKSVLQFWVMEPLKDALQRRADFLMTNCRITNPSDLHYKGFLEWNNVTNVAKTGGNGCNDNDYEQMYDGPAFIAEKNIYYPVQSEITAIDDYLGDLVWAKEVFTDTNDPDYGFLCHHCCDKFCWGDDWNLTTNPKHKCQRIYNYPRIYNTFFSMYNVAKRYPDLTFRFSGANAKTYLERAALIAKRGISLSFGTGTMGEQTIADICKALDEEGLTATATELRNLASSKCTAMNNQTYPFGSEFGTDNTAEEGAYFYSKMFGRIDGMQKTVDKTIAWKGKTPVWYWQTTGNRQDNDWWLFQYTVGLQGKLLEDWYMNNQSSGKDYWSMVYPFKLAPFVHIISGQPETIGALGSNWGNYKSSSPYNWNIGFPYSESAESDISLWAGLRLLSSDVVVNDPNFGLVGYGCNVTDGGTTYDVTPKDGLYRRLNIVDDKLQVETANDKFSFAKIGKSKNYIELTLNNVSGIGHTGKFNVRGLATGIYKIYVDGIDQGIVPVLNADNVTTVSYTIGTAANYNIKLQKGGGSSTTVTYQAEDGTLDRCYKRTSKTGYTGTGYVDGFINGPVGTSVTFNNVSASSAGNYSLAIRYSYEYTTNCTNLGLYVNGIKIKNLTFTKTGVNVWSTITETVSLNQGNNTIQIRIETVSGNSIFLDKCDLTGNQIQNIAPIVEVGNDQRLSLPGSVNLQGNAVDDDLPAGTLTYAWSKVSGPGTVTFTSPTSLTTSATFSSAGTYVLQLSANDGALIGSDTLTVIVTSAYQAENANYSRCFVATSQTGYTGTGYIDGFINGPVGASVTFTVTAPAVGTNNLIIRYSYEYTPNCTNMGLYVNGTKIKDLTFTKTGSFSTWSNITEQVTLNAGSNTIMLRIETASDKAIMLDKIEL